MFHRLYISALAFSRSSIGGRNGVWPIHGWNWMCCSQSLTEGNPAEIVLDVLLADSADRDDLAGAVRQRLSKDRLAQEDSLAVMAQRTMAHVGEVCLALVEPVMGAR